MAPTRQPSQKNIVELLMPVDRVEHRDVHGRNGQRKQVAHNVFRCPKGDLCISNSRADESRTGEYICQADAGYTIPFRHLLRCYAGNNRDYSSKSTKKV